MIAAAPIRCPVGTAALVSERPISVADTPQTGVGSEIVNLAET